MRSTSLEACLTRAYAELPKEWNSQTNRVEIVGGSAILDLSSTRFIRIDSLMFLLCVMSYLKRQGVALRLWLPEENGKWDYPPGSPHERVARTRDFLKRWEFEAALEEAAGPINELLVPHQENYFMGPQRFYCEKIAADEYGQATRYLSSLMLEITHMTRGDPGRKRVSRDRIVAFGEICM